MGLTRIGAVVAAAFLSGAALASPFTLSYCAVPSSAGFDYTFTLTMDNNDGSWQPGQGIGWIIFGDTATSPSPLDGFVADPSSFPVGQWTVVQGTGGGHNGPTLGPVVVQSPPYDPILWVPTQVGDHLTWRGTAPASVPDGQMLWSALMSQGRGTVQFETGMIACGTTACGTQDFDGDGDSGTDQDIEAFFRCLAGTCCATCYPGGSDFNADGDAGTDQDIESFFRVLAGGNC